MCAANKYICEIEPGRGWHYEVEGYGRLAQKHVGAGSQNRSSFCLVKILANTPKDSNG